MLINLFLSILAKLLNKRKEFHASVKFKRLVFTEFSWHEVNTHLSNKNHTGPIDDFF